jgi:hypothetical protein
MEKAKMAITEEDLAGLSASEREFLESVDENDEEMLAAMGKAPREGDGEDPDDGDDGDEQPAEDEGGDPDGDDAAGQDDAGDEGQPDGDEQGAQQDAEEDKPVRPQPSTPADASDQRKTLRAERAAAMQQMIDGEISAEQFGEQDAAIQDKLDALARAEAVDQARAQIAQDTMLGEYRSELRATMKMAKDAGLTDIDDANSDNGKAFDRALRMFGQEATERGLMDAPGNLAASKEALSEALALVMRRNGKTAAPESKPDQEAAKPAAKQRPPVDRSKLPPTLATAPAALDASVGGGEFAHLANLEGPALERAVAKLSPEQMERYLGD